ncbi:hypothetical protein GCM10023231_03430 [Olivibacter ginsenosidimutans]|uniref:Tetratricopeptide repeat protein n=1 Tax=Olivibacter ginsenosidimutans TaxID=1176537 RepID=A0ABP9AGP1_9SPHI
MLKADLLKLVKATSAVEQKYFRIQFAAASKEPEFLKLFNLITKYAPSNTQELDTLYQAHFPKATSIDNHAQYLFKLLTDSLVKLRIDQDKGFYRYFGLLRARLFAERSMPLRGLQELKKVAKQCVSLEDPLTDFIYIREELSLLNRLGYPQMTEKELIDLQMKAKNKLRVIRQLHEHYSLYEMLHFRLGNAPISSLVPSDLADLLLNELSVISRGHTNTFEQQKLHLLFQSFYFMQSNEYKLALNVFKQLNQLFEANENHWDFPPYDYLMALEGILDNLYTINYGLELAQFLEKIHHLMSSDYPEHFKLKAQQIHLIYSIKQYLISKNFDQAKKRIQHIQKDKQLTYLMVDGEKHAEFNFLASIVYFQEKNFRQAKHYIRQAQFLTASRSLHMLHRAIQLFQFLISYELDDMDYLTYEIRNYKRSFKHGINMLRSEKLLCYVLTLNPKRLSKARKKIALSKCQKNMRHITQEKDEMKLLKHYDFCSWIAQSLDAFHIDN